jgi:glucose-1-phosphate thymidylyltransferase
MKVVIPLAGFGTRLRPHTYTVPKPLIPVAGKAVLGHILDKLVDLEIDEVIFIIGYLGDQIRDYVQRNYRFAARYIEQKELKGQAHALYLAKDHLSGPVLIIFVDTIFEADVSVLANEPADGVIYVKEVEDPRRFGVVVTEGGHITRLVEKPSTPVSNLAVIGVYYIRNSQLLMHSIADLIAQDIKTKGEYFLADALQLMINGGAKFAARTVEVWEDCGKPETVLHTNRYLLDHGAAQEIETENSVLIPPVYIDKSAVIKDSVIGPYVSVAAGVTVVRSIIWDSIINEGAQIEGANLSQSLVGKDAHVRGSAQRLNVGDTSHVELVGNGVD